MLCTWQASNIVKTISDVTDDSDCPDDVDDHLANSSRSEANQPGPSSRPDETDQGASCRSLPILDADLLEEPDRDARVSGEAVLDDTNPVYSTGDRPAI